MNVCILGLGYIGLPTAAIVASAGHKVVGVDINSNVVETINRGEIHITEPGLKEMVFDCVKSGNLSASTKISPADVFMIAVPTPFKSDKSNSTPIPDLTHVFEAVKQICCVLKSGDLISWSSSPIGTRSLSTFIDDELKRLRDQRQSRLSNQLIVGAGDTGESNA